MPSVEHAGEPVLSPKAAFNRKASLLSLGSVVLFCVLFLWMAAGIIPRFTASWEMLGNKPFPALTYLVIHFRWPLFIFDSGCALLGAILIRFKASSGCLLAISLLLLGQVYIAVLALFLPFIPIHRMVGG